MNEDVSSWPSVDFVKQLPDWISVRVSVTESGKLAACLWSEQHQKNCVWLLNECGDDAWKAARSNIGGAIFEAEYPNEFPAMIRRQAESLARGVELSAEDQSLWERYRGLTR